MKAIGMCSDLWCVCRWDSGGFFKATPDHVMFAMVARACVSCSVNHRLRSLAPSLLGLSFAFLRCPGDVLTTTLCMQQVDKNAMHSCRANCRTAVHPRAHPEGLVTITSTNQHTWS
jgi:hypothetical protein